MQIHLLLLRAEKQNGAEAQHSSTFCFDFQAKKKVCFGVKMRVSHSGKDEGGVNHT